MDNSFRNGLFLDRFHVNSMTIIGDFNDNHVTFIARLEKDGTFLGFAECKAFFGSFDTVIKRIADAMHDRIEQILDNGLVELGFLSLNYELDALIKVTGRAARAAESGWISGCSEPCGFS
jgi:hypothetical protein